MSRSCDQGTSRRAHPGGRFVLACVGAWVLVTAGATNVASAAPEPFVARDADVTSFDGAVIKVRLLPARGLTAGQRAPTVLVGSGWSAPAYPDWLPTFGAISLGPLSFNGEFLGPASLAAAGYNVVTWANRGWWGSGGEVMIDHPDYEGRDVSAILDWLAAQPEAVLDEPGDPRVGMTGASYGGGIQLSAAVLEHRLDVIEPNMAWNDLLDALYPNDTIKAGWGNLLCAASSLTFARRSQQLVDLCASAISGVVTEDEIAFGRAASPGERVAAITTPTLLLGGTVDTLFPPSGNVTTYERLRRSGTPVKMMWYCGGHGVCDQGTGPYGHVIDVQLAFLARYLRDGAARDEAIRSGLTQPGFEYLDQDGTWHSSPSYPPRRTDRLTARGDGTLEISPEHRSGFFGVVATKAENAVTIALPPPDGDALVAGPPTLRLTYRGRATVPDTPVYAQLIDTATGKVVGNQATPVPLRLDGRRRTVTLPLEPVVWRLGPASRLALQLTDNSNLFFASGARGSVDLDGRVTLPLSAPGVARTP